MRFKIYTKNPVNMNIGYVPYGNDSLDFMSEIECNYRYITPTSITVESDTVFYYAIDENDNAWRTVDIAYITNSKVSIKMISQTLNLFKVDENVIANGDINAEMSDFSTTSDFNRVLNSASSWLSLNEYHVVDKVDLFQDNETDTPYNNNYIILQLTHPICEDATSGDDDSELVIVGDWTIDSYFKSGDTAPTYYDYGTISRQRDYLGGALGLYTYYINSESKSKLNNAVKFLTTLMNTDTGFVNARMVKLPYFTGAFAGVMGTIRNGDDEFDINKIDTFIPVPYVLDTIPSNQLLYGNTYWKIGDYKIYPNVMERVMNEVSEFVASLRFTIVIGVGTVFGVFYSGEYEDIMINNQSACVFELGYNLAPNTINPTLYYSNKQYQSLVDSAPYTQGATSFSAGLMGSLLLPTVPAKIVGVGVAVANAGATALKAQQVAERERHNKNSVINVNDAQNLSNYIRYSNQVLRISNTYDNITICKAIIDNYIPHNYKTTVNRYVKIIKCNYIEGEINTVLYREGCVVCNNETLLEALTTSNI